MRLTQTTDLNSATAQQMEKSTAVPSASPPRIVTLASVPFRVLLMSGQTTDAAEFLEAWSQTVPAQSFHPAEVSHFSFASPPNVLSALALLDSVRKGCFHAVIMMPPATSWSRLRHLADESQRPLRTRAFPLGLPELDAEAVSKTQCSNRQLEVTSWICEQAAQCKNRRVAILMTFPEDFAGHVSHGPASPWALEDFRSLQLHAGEVQRYAVYLCRFAGTEQRRAVGCWSNFRALQQEGYTGWPTHVRHAAQLQYTGPLPRSCPCVTQHMPMRGTASGQEFNSTQQQTLGVQFWLRALRDASRQSPFPLGMAFLLSWSLFRLLRFGRSQPQRSLGLRCTERGRRVRSHEVCSETTQIHRLWNGTCQGQLLPLARSFPLNP